MILNSIRKVNSFFKSANKDDVDNILSKILLSERQETIFNMFYIRKRDIGYIADTLYVSDSVVKRELKHIRAKILTLI